jgi:formiminotetrahydrofolate cyclodeaminase
MTRIEMYEKRKSLGIPEPKELSQYRKLLSEHVKPNDKVLILGATTELREIALELGCKVLAIDINIEMIYNRDKIMKIKNNVNDVIARGDWLYPWFLKKNVLKLF